MLNNSNKLPFFGFGTTHGRDDNHNDKNNTSYYTKDSSIAALEAFQRDYLPSASGAAALASQRLPSVSLSSLRPPASPPSPGPRPPSSSPSLSHLGHQSHAFDEQFKDVSSHPAWSFDLNCNVTIKNLSHLYSFTKSTITHGEQSSWMIYSVSCRKEVGININD